MCPFCDRGYASKVIFNLMASSVNPIDLKEWSDPGLYCLPVPFCQKLWCTNFRTFTELIVYKCHHDSR